MKTTLWARTFGLVVLAGLLSTFMGCATHRPMVNPEDEVSEIQINDSDSASDVSLHHSHGDESFNDMLSDR